MKQFFVLLVAALTVLGISAADNKTATASISGANNITGSVTFKEIDDGLIQITGSVSGLSPGKHGFHIHSSNNLTENCANTGSHLNPQNVLHGGPTDSTRHVGDLGNIVAEANGVANINFTDKIIALDGENSIVGRSVVVHAGEDDLGKGGSELSNTTGNAGAKIACGEILLASAGNANHLIFNIMTVLSLILFLNMAL